MAEPKVKKYQVTASIVRIESYLEEHVRLPKLSQAQILDAISKQLMMDVRDDTTHRFTPATDPKTKQKRERGNTGFYFGGKITLPEEG